MNDTTQQDVATRVWEHALHEETIYNDRLNFFLVAEAMLLVFYATLGTAVHDRTLIAIAVLGLIVTIMWLMINIRQEADFKEAVARLKDYCPEYQSYVTKREEKGAFRNVDKSILGKGVPVVVGLAWVALITDVLIP